MLHSLRSFLHLCPRKVAQPLRYGVVGTTFEQPSFLGSTASLFPDMIVFDGSVHVYSHGRYCYLVPVGRKIVGII
jgi:hypothetical protein